VPPPDLVKGLRCERWGVLPRAGGLGDQPAGEFLRMEAALSVYHAFRARAGAKNSVEFTNRFPEISAFCWEIEQMENEEEPEGMPCYG
jgi:hypothetical protein